MASKVAPKKILVVEDDPMVAELLLTRLDLAGYRTGLARDGIHAMAALRAEIPDAVILDLNMPRADGFDVLRYLNERSGGRQPRVMVISARRSEDDVRRCVSLGATDFISKPFDERTFLKRIARLTRDHVERAPSTDDLLI